MMSVNIWEVTVSYDELTINESPKKTEYGDLREEVRRGCTSSKAVRLLRDRLMPGSDLDQFEGLHLCCQSPVCLFPTRKSCKQFNTQMLALLESSTVEVLSSDETTGA